MGTVLGNCPALLLLYILLYIQKRPEHPEEINICRLYKHLSQGGNQTYNLLRHRRTFAHRTTEVVSIGRISHSLFFLLTWVPIFADIWEFQKPVFISRDFLLYMPKMDTFYRVFIESCGGNLNKIYAAMDSDDLAQLVRATTNVLKKANWQPDNIYLPKSTEASAQYRIEGNAHYNAGRKRQAVELYNKAIAFAPLDSVELELAFGNRSAVLYAIKHYSGCVQDLLYVSEIVAKKNKSLDDKLKKRLELAMQYTLLKRTEYFMNNIPIAMTFFNFGCEKNTDVPCVSTQVTFTSDKRIKAKTTIRPGTLVGLEKAYASCTDDEGRYLSCYYCHRLDLCLVPCVGCTVLFCNKNCMKLCNDEYHSIECHIICYISHPQHILEYQLMRKTAIKLSLNLGWDAFVTESRNIGLSRMKNSSVKETYNSNTPTSILSYDDADKYLIEGRLFNGSFVCSALLQLLEENPCYFPKDKIKKAEAWDAMARVMLHLSATYNKIHIKCTAYDLQGKKEPIRTNAQTNCGWFSMSSKLKHSCTPNLQVFGMSDAIGLVALRTIRKGEELTICCYENFYENILTKTMPHDRCLQISLKYSHFCECQVCTKNWDSTSAIDIQMTKSQSKLFKKVEKITNDIYLTRFYDLCNVLDGFPYNCWQHKYAYQNLMDMINTILCKYRENKTYFSDD